MPATGSSGKPTYSLSIRLHAGGFSFYLLNTVRLSVLEVEDYAYDGNLSSVETLKRAIEGSTLVSRADGGVVYCVVADRSVQVPLEYFRKEEAKTMLGMVFAKPIEGKVHYNILSHVELAQVFAVGSDIERVLSARLGQIRFYHSHSMILEKMWGVQQGGMRRLFAYFDEEGMFVFHFKDRRLVFANSFSVDSVENVVYFLLSVWKDLELSAMNDVCVCLGYNSMLGDIVVHTRKYLQQVEQPVVSDLFRHPLSAEGSATLPFDVQTLLAQII